MSVNTLITIKDALTDFVDGHDQIKRIEFEADDHRAPEIESGKDFPVMFVAPISVRVERAMNVHRLKIYIYERINDNRDDIYENANDTSLMLRDIRVWWNDSNELSDINIIEDPTGEFLSDRELDNVVGYYAFFDFEIPSHGRCDVPVSITPTPPTPCPDGTVNVNQSDGTLLSAVTVPSGGLENYNVADSVITVDSAPFIDLKATDPLDVNLIDQNNQQITPLSLATPNIKVQQFQGSALYKTGAFQVRVAGDDASTQRGVGIDWYNLGYNNPFGHQKRFTGYTGGYYEESDGTYRDVNGAVTTNALAFPDDLVLNWSTYNGILQEVDAIYRVLDNVGKTYSQNETYVSGLTVGGYSDFLVPNIDELWAWAWKSNNNASSDRALLYEPLITNLTPNAGLGQGGFRYWSSTIHSDDNVKILGNNYAEIFNGSQTFTGGRSVAIRKFTMTELGII